MAELLPPAPVPPAEPGAAGAIAPGFLVVQGNHAESLRALLVAWLARQPLAPLETEWLLVPSNGVAQWLKLALAADPAEGGLGLAAGLATELPARFLWQAYRAVLGESAVPASSPYDRELLALRLMRLLPGLLAAPAFAPLAGFLAQDADGRKRQQLADRLADLFDGYQVYRADWLADWAEGRDRLARPGAEPLPLPTEQAWQPALWRALRADVQAQLGEAAAEGGRASVHRRFLAAAQAPGTPRPAGLPRRVAVFGLSSLPPQTLEALAALGRWVQVLMLVHNPCEHEWSHLVAARDALRQASRRRPRRPGSEGPIAEDALHLHAQPLLAAWGQQGRDFLRLLAQHDEPEAYAGRFAAIGQRIDCFDPNPQDSLLRQLQDDIRDLRPLAETRARWPEVDPARDGSIRFHIAHGPQREVEALHDALLDAFAADPSLQPREVIVMVPEVADYAPHVQAVFGRHAPGDPRHLPFSLADRGQRRHDPLLAVLEGLLALPTRRLTVAEVLDSLAVPALRARFGLDEAELPRLRRWAEAARIRWGLHAGQREALGLPGLGGQHGWDAGLQRMLLGHAVGEGPAWQGVEPLGEVGGLEAASLGPLIALLDTLERHRLALAEPAPPAAWGERLRALLDDCFQADDEADGYTLLRLDAALQAWLDACAAAGLDEPLPLASVAEPWLAALDRPALNQPFFAGAITVATLMPMRAIPFRVVALLGMQDGAYPRSRPPLDFDLMAADRRPGDRSRREDDRYLFLEALLSAREKLIVSWVGRSAQEPRERPASVLVAELREHLAAGWRLAGSPEAAEDDAAARRAAGQALLAALTVEHRLQPFHPAYFALPEDGGDLRLRSHEPAWRAGWQGPVASAGAGGAALAPLPPEASLRLAELQRMLKNPAASFLSRRLKVGLYEAAEEAAEHEPFDLSGLDVWALREAWIPELLDARAHGGPAPALHLEALRARAARRGDLPGGAFGTLAGERAARPLLAMLEALDELDADAPQPLPDEALDLPLPGGAQVLDRLDGLRAWADGRRLRQVVLPTDLVKDRHLRLDKLLGPWLVHLAAHAAGRPMESRVLSPVGHITLRPLEAAEAQAAWQALGEAWQQHLCAPLPLAPQAGFAWLEALRKAGLPADTPAAAFPEGREAVRRVAEDPVSGAGAQRRPGERLGSEALARCFPSFEALWAGGGFVDAVQRLLAPLDAAVLRPEGKGRGRRGAAPAGGEGEGA
ncbi:exodeoxyribonuclease V subunit gamma [Piscinibacter sp. Jin2]|uniref:RecBCD enzyme subunit RecC n=1 Tax=Aquariibacter lacus TaxID=2801332 RepID=A0A9X0XGI7_9BURK|nr:exodeoxyribonuclease V subunit gamma [Piscinibacter lacus]MBL0720521.1 exodeoxyribonuclease V subunit gamma [Piscinibacter lacus]